MKMIKYLLLLAAVAVAVPAVAQITDEVGRQPVERLEYEALPTNFLQEVSLDSLQQAPVQTGELNNYEYRVEATDQNKKGKYKGLVAKAINEDKGYSLVMQILPGGAVHKFCAGSEEVCKSISNGVECGDTWKAWCYLPQESFLDEPVVVSKDVQVADNLKSIEVQEKVRSAK